MAGEMRQAHSKNEGRFYAYHLKSFVPLTMQTVATDEVVAISMSHFAATCRS